MINTHQEPFMKSLEALAHHLPKFSTATSKKKESVVIDSMYKIKLQRVSLIISDLSLPKDIIESINEESIKESTNSGFIRESTRYETNTEKGIFLANHQ
jgi:hypothetical protein